MSEKEKVRNIVAFLSIIFGEDWQCFDKILDFSPEYLIEKFERYVLSTRNEADWGLHPSLKRTVFDAYCEKYGLPITMEI